ncbi:MAG: CDF family Co(II)/Ni(II) efflux transporter DmeF [Pseudomonadota bacterium]
MIDSEHHCQSPRFDAGNPLAERSVRRAFWLTSVMMVIEIAGGWWYSSMAVLADGWHMSSHSVALGLSAFAYAYARRQARHRAYAFGTWKVEVLGGYTSAIVLLAVATLMVYQSIERLLSPQTIHYTQAIVIAVVGLAVNLVCAFWLRGTHAHDHAQEASHEHTHDHPFDMNARSAYVHVLADAATSVFAIVALLGGLAWGLAWLDPVMGLVGAALVSVWAWGLLRDSGRILLDAEMDAPVVAEIRYVIERGEVPARITDLHVWRVGRQKYAVVLSLTTPSGEGGDYFRRALCVHEELAHVTVEVERGPAPGP